MNIVSVLLASSIILGVSWADTYSKSICNAVHWTHMLEGRIIVEGNEPRPRDIENLSFLEHDLPPNHRIIHTWDSDVLDVHHDRLSIYVDRENIFQAAYCA